MSVEFRCDGCNKIGQPKIMVDEITNNPAWILPDGWLDTLNDPHVNAQDTDIACSVECAKKVSEMQGLKASIEGELNNG